MSFRRRIGGRRGRADALDAEQAADPGAARAAAIGLLARREYASAELSAALSRKGFQAEAIEPAIEELTAERLLDDSRYAASLVRMLVGRGQGPQRIRQAMAEVSLPSALIEEALSEAPDFNSLAADVRRRRFGDEVPGDWAERARQMRFLQYRGFSGDHISHALAASPDD